MADYAQVLGLTSIVLVCYSSFRGCITSVYYEFVHVAVVCSAGCYGRFVLENIWFCFTDWCWLGYRFSVFDCEMSHSPNITTYKAVSVKHEGRDDEFCCTVHRYALKPPWHIPLPSVFLISSNAWKLPDWSFFVKFSSYHLIKWVPSICNPNVKFAVDKKVTFLALENVTCR